MANRIIARVGGWPATVKMAFAACSFQINTMSGWAVGACEMAPASWAEEVNGPKPTVARLRSRTAMICRLRRRSIVTFVDFIVFSLRNPGYSSLCGPCDFVSDSLSEAHGLEVTRTQERFVSLITAKSYPRVLPRFWLKPI